jgi:hypothetical protein
MAGRSHASEERGHCSAVRPRSGLMIGVEVFTGESVGLFLLLRAVINRASALK